MQAHQENIPLDAAASRPALTRWLSLPLTGVDIAMTTILGVTLAVEVGVMFANAMSRAFAGGAIIWSSEIANLSLAILIFGGAASAYRRGEHMAATAVIDRLRTSQRAFVDAFNEWLVLAISLAIAVLSLRLIPLTSVSRSLVLHIPQSWPTYAMSIGMFVTAAFAFEKLAQRSLRTAIVSLPFALTLVLACVEAPKHWVPTTDQTGIVVAIVFAVLVLAGLPIAFVFAAAAFTFNGLGVLGPPSTVPFDTLQGSEGIILLAIPIFILAGALMTAGGLTVPLADLVLLLVGRIRGGLLHVVVATMFIFSGISGSKLADVAAVGSAMEGMFERSEHSRGERAAVLAASAAMGETIPPSIGLLVLGSVTSLSIGGLFLAGIVPAAVVAVLLMAFIYVRARRGEAPARVPITASHVIKTTLFALPALSIPVIIVGGIVGGIATPTDSSSFAVVCALILALLYRKAPTWNLVRLLGDSARLTGMLLFILCTATALTQALTLALIPQRVAGGLQAIAHNKWSFLLISIAILIVMGAVLEGLPAILIFGPLLLPVAADYGIDPLQYGIVLLLSLGIGSFAPPIGIGLYAACSVSRTSIESSVKPILPYLGILIVGVVVIAFVPWFSLFLPHHFGP